MTRIPACTVSFCPFPADPDFHACFCGSLAIEHHHVISRGLGGSKKRKNDPANVICLCHTHHEEVTLHRATVYIEALPWRERGLIYLDFKGNEVGRRMLPACDGADDTGSRSLASVQPSASSQAGEGEPIAPLLSSPSSPALMDAEGEQVARPSSATGSGANFPAIFPSAFSRESWLSEGERLLTMGLQLKGMTDSWRFEIGDWVASGEQHLGEEAYGHFARFEDAFGASYLRGLGWVAASVSRETRQLCPSWSHARAVAVLPQAKQEAILATAQAEGLSSRQVAALARPEPPEREPCICPTCQNKHYPLVSKEWK